MPRWPLSSGFKLNRPLLILFASIGLTAVAVIEAQRAVRSQQEIATRALQEYATFAAWSYAQHLTTALGSLAREALGAVNHDGSLHRSHQIPDARELAHYLSYDPNCPCHRAKFGPNPDTFFALKIGSDTLDVAINRHPDAADGWEVDRPMPVPLPVTTPGDYTAPERRWVLDTLLHRIRAERLPDSGYTLVIGNVENKPRIITYTLMPTAWGDTMVYGARYSSTSLARILAGVLDNSGLLPSTFTAGRSNREVLAVRVRDQNGNNLFYSSPGVTSPLNAHLELPSRMGLLSIDVDLLPKTAEKLILYSVPASKLPYLLGLLALAASLSVIAVMQLRREGELARLRSDFVSSVSHELRTPLAQIRLYVETMRLGRANTEQQRAWSLGHIERETTRLSNLVENTLQFSRSGHVDVVAPEPTDVSAQVRRIVDEFRPLAQSRSATIETTIAATSSIALRPDAIRHILVNLLDNAVKYGNTGQTIHVALVERDGKLQLSVSNEGNAIATGERASIWQPFTRGTTAKGQGGSGIGLSIVRDVVEQHGGRAWIDDDVDGNTRRTRFNVELPTHT